jgi:hypothetical protein
VQQLRQRCLEALGRDFRPKPALVPGSTADTVTEAAGGSTDGVAAGDGSMVVAEDG